MRPHTRKHKKQFISAVATSLFLEKGFSSTTVEDIAARAGISPRTFFRYYRTKADVLVEQQAARVQRLREQVRVAPRRFGLLEAMESVAREHARYLQEEDLPRLMQLWVEDPVLKRRRLELLHIEIPMLLAGDFASREGLSSYTPSHILAGRQLMTVLDASLTPDVLEGRVPLVEQVDATLRSWKAELEAWVASSPGDDEYGALWMVNEKASPRSAGRKSTA